MKNPKLTFQALISVAALLLLSVFSNEEGFRAEYLPEFKKTDEVVKETSVQKIKTKNSQKVNQRIDAAKLVNKANALDQVAATNTVAEQQILKFKELFSRNFNRLAYREFVRNGAKSQGSDFALKVSDQLRSLEEMQSEGLINVSHVAGFYRDCATEYPSELPSFVQALCLRRLERYSYFRQGARPELETAKRNSHPAVQELFAILSKQED